MRKILAALLVVLFLSGFASSCFPSGYESGNPNRSNTDQVKVDENQQTDNSQATETPAPEEGSGQ